MNTKFDLVPLGSLAVLTFGHHNGTVVEVVGHNYLDNTVTVYFSDDMRELVVHVDGVRATA